MLASGEYPPMLKQRVAGPWGHLSNEQAADFLQRMDCARLRHLVMAHISQKNNCLSLARAVLEPVTSQVQNVIYACQEQGDRKSTRLNSSHVAISYAVF